MHCHLKTNTIACSYQLSKRKLDKTQNLLPTVYKLRLIIDRKEDSMHISSKPMKYRKKVHIAMMNDELQ